MRLRAAEGALWRPKVTTDSHSRCPRHALEGKPHRTLNGRLYARIAAPRLQEFEQIFEGDRAVVEPCPPQPEPPMPFPEPEPCNGSAWQSDSLTQQQVDPGSPPASRYSQHDPWVGVQYQGTPNPISQPNISQPSHPPILSSLAHQHHSQGSTTTTTTVSPHTSTTVVSVGNDSPDMSVGSTTTTREPSVESSNHSRHSSPEPSSRRTSTVAELLQRMSPAPSAASAASAVNAAAAASAAVVINAASAANAAAAAAYQEVRDNRACAPAKLWALFVLSATYVHQAASGSSIPVMLPMITQSLTLTDFQGALLNTGYTCVYAIALVPAGVLADRVPKRSALLGVSTAIWTALQAAAAHAGGFTELMVARLGLAVAQSTQNVVCFSVIPDLFPKNKSTALSLYNCAIYCGRGLIYLAFNTAPDQVADQSVSQLVQTDALGNLMVPLDKVDLRLVQLMYTSGDMAAIRASSPLYGISGSLAEATGLTDGVVADTVWRQVLEKLTLPGALLAGALLLTVREPKRTVLPPPPSLATSPLDGDGIKVASVPAGPLAGAAAAVAGAQEVAPAVGSAIWRLMTCGPFMWTTAAAALNDVASYAMIAWQSTFYERIYHLTISEYAPVLATLLPLSGIIGGVGGGLLADRLALKGQRAWVTVVTSLLAGPLIWGSLTASTANESFLYLAIGFALSEAWRAPSAVMARSVVPSSQASTAMSLYLCIRNVIGGFGPLMVAHMSHVWDLQRALELLPGLYVASGLLFWRAEQLLADYKPPPEDQLVPTPEKQ